MQLAAHPHLSLQPRSASTIIHMLAEPLSSPSITWSFGRVPEAGWCQGACPSSHLGQTASSHSKPRARTCHGPCRTKEPYSATHPREMHTPHKWCRAPASAVCLTCCAMSAPSVRVVSGPKLADTCTHTHFHVSVSAFISTAHACQSSAGHFSASCSTNNKGLGVLPLQEQPQAPPGTTW